MTTILLKFGFVMGVVMLGFTMAFHVLFRDFDSFGESFLDLFRAMLGETSFFTEFSGDTYDAVATILLVVYLFIVTIITDTNVSTPTIIGPTFTNTAAPLVIVRLITTTTTGIVCCIVVFRRWRRWWPSYPLLGWWRRRCKITNTPE